MRIIISDIIKEQRKRLGISQETLANEFGISVQAVSKWENGLSCPDIALLPAIADYFGVTIDYLLTGRAVASPDSSDSGEPEVPPAAVYTVAGDSEITDKCPSPDMLYIVQIYNGHIISAIKNPVDPISLELPNGVWNISVHAPAAFGDVKGTIAVADGGEAGFNGEIRGNISVTNASGSIGFNHDVNGDVTVTNGGFSASGDINGDVYVTGGGCTINSEVNGDVSVTGGHCTINGDVSSDVSVTTGNLTVNGDLNAEGDVSVMNGSLNCTGDANIEGDVDGTVACSGDVNVEGDVNGNVACDGDANIEGDVNGHVFCKNGDVNVEGDVNGDTVCEAQSRAEAEKIRAEAQKAQERAREEAAKLCAEAEERALEEATKFRAEAEERAYEEAAKLRAEAEKWYAEAEKRRDEVLRSINTQNEKR